MLWKGIESKTKRKKHFYNLDIFNLIGSTKYCIYFDPFSPIYDFQIGKQFVQKNLVNFDKIFRETAIFLEHKLRAFHLPQVTTESR